MEGARELSQALIPECFGLVTYSPPSTLPPITINTHVEGQDSTYEFGGGGGWQGKGDKHSV